MLTGLHQDALSQYSMATEHLRTVNDFLWLAGALEGQCASSIAVNSSGVDRTSKFLILPTDCAGKTSNVTSNGFGNDFDETKFKNVAPLPYEEIYDRLSEAVFFYGRVSIFFHYLSTKTSQASGFFFSFSRKPRCLNFSWV